MASSFAQKEMYGFYSRIVNGPGSRPLLMGQTFASGLRVPEGTVVGRIWEHNKPRYLLEPELQNDISTPEKILFYLINEAIAADSHQEEYPGEASVLGSANLTWYCWDRGKMVKSWLLALDLNTEGKAEVVLTDGVGDPAVMEGYSWEELAPIGEEFYDQLAEFIYSQGWTDNPAIEPYIRYELAPEAIKGAIILLGATVLEAC